MKNHLILKLFTFFSSLLLSLTSCNNIATLIKPIDYKEELWLLDNVENFSFSAYYSFQPSGYFGSSTFYYKKEYGNYFIDSFYQIVLPTEYVLYEVGPFPDLSLHNRYVTSITIKDENISIYGLNLNSSKNKFISTFKALDFNLDESFFNQIRLKKDNLVVSFIEKEEIMIKSLITNNQGIIF